MLTTDGNYKLYLGDYSLSSPESYLGGNSSPEYSDIKSDEDFLQQLSSDLDIPLLLNSNDDELGVLGSFLDQSPDEILSQISSPLGNQIDDALSHHFQIVPDNPPFKTFEEIKVENEEFSSSDSNKSTSPIPAKDTFTWDIKNEVTPPKRNLKRKNSTVSLSSPKDDLTKGVPLHKPTVIKPKCINFNNFPIREQTANSIVIVNKTVDGNINLKEPVVQPPKVVLLKNVTNFSQINATNTTAKVVLPPLFMSSQSQQQQSSIFNLGASNVDPKIFKRQQRKIKNRESACLSRKKKRDYLTSLEEKVKDLEKENEEMKLENLELRARLAQFEALQNHIPSKKLKKSVALCAFLLVMGINFNFIRNPLQSEVDLVLKDNLLNTNGRNFRGRHLLSIDNSSEGNLNNQSKFQPLTMCPLGINQTESARLVLELERWIGKPSNISNNQPSIKSAHKNIKKYHLKRRRFQMDSIVPSLMGLDKKYKFPRSEDNPPNEIQLFTPGPEQIYSEFFDAIKRQKDTFYVVSFSESHLLLPALHHNRTQRPKMSLIMPTMLLGDNLSQPTLVPLMQIDCEVLDTRLIHVKYGSIPQHLKKNTNIRSNTSETDPNIEPKEEQNVTNRTQKPLSSMMLNKSKISTVQNKPYKPYFLNSSDSNYVPNESYDFN